jgi:hypothetical protein
VVTPARRFGRPLLATLAVLVSVGIYFLTQVSMLFWRSNFSWSSFRDYFASDQLSYLSMVVNGKHGLFAPVEPFTESGANNYPHLYYTVLGFIAHTFDGSPIAAWEIGGVLLQAMLVAGIAFASIFVSGRIWTGFFGAFPLMIGTFSSWHSAGWFTQMNSHAVLWGPFGVLFTLNGESAALSFGGTALVLLLAVVLRQDTTARTRFVMGIIAALVIGVLANVQTYSFLTIAYIAGYSLAAYALASTRRRWLIIPSVLLVPVVFLIGPPVADHVSQLVTLLIGLLPAVPGLVDLVLRTRGRFAIFLGVAALASSPQIVGTWIALRAGDPFLTYRVASSKDLGVGIFDGFTCAIALAIPLVLILIAGIHRKNPIWIGYSIGASAAWILVAGNDRWGANQEPYRFWIDGFAIVAMTIVPVALSVAFTYLGSARPSAPAVTRRVRTIVVVGIVVALVGAGLSARDWVYFYVGASRTALLSFASAQDVALAQVVSGVSRGIVLTDPCIDPVTLKTVSDVPVAYFNFGMAWPAHEPNVENVLLARSAGVLRPNALSPAGIRWLVTDGTCSAHWPSKYRTTLHKVKTVRYGTRGGETVTLWKTGR